MLKWQAAVVGERAIFTASHGCRRYQACLRSVYHFIQYFYFRLSLSSDLLTHFFCFCFLLSHYVFALSGLVVLQRSMTLEEEARDLVSAIAKERGKDGYIVILSPAVWWHGLGVHNHQSDEEGCHRWLFLESSQTVLVSQKKGGSWGNNASQVEGTIHTTAAFLAVFRHQRLSSIHGCHNLPENVALCIEQAQRWPKRALHHKDVRNANRVGFELLLTTLLGLLAKERLQIYIFWPDAQPGWPNTNK